MNNPNFDYSQTMMMKMDIGFPDDNNGSIIFNTFSQVLEKVKIIDKLTFGAPKIIYLVGWQYKGHDSKYPAFFYVNKDAVEHNKRRAYKALIKLMDDCREYNTIISLHINLSDAYKNSPLWKTYYENNLILRDKNGRLLVTGNYNGLDAYHVRTKAEYESGFFKKRVDALIGMYHLDKIGTVHIDAFFVWKGLDTTIPEEKKYRRKMIEYFNSKNVDVTTEFIYREKNNGCRSFWGKSDIVGLVPAVWNLRMTQADYFRYPPTLLAGGELCMDIQFDKDLQYLFYGNAHCESCFNQKEWTEDFIREFSLKTVPYFFLNKRKLRRISGVGKNRTAHFDMGVRTSINGKRITQYNIVLKEEETLCIPITWEAYTYYAFSGEGGCHTFSLPDGDADMYELCADGKNHIFSGRISKSSLTLDMKRNTGYIIQYKDPIKIRSNTSE